MKKAVIILSLLLSINTLSAQNKNPKYVAYIEKYAQLAINSQKKHHIPASITLAQGLLESAAGESKLAVKCNNHFGIKCGSSWYGRTMRQNDDAIGECFRCYDNPKASYDDHAEFLKRQRYAFLFDYAITDYKSWAHGLKRAGYATDPAYPNKLIRLIEDYQLYQYDTMTAAPDNDKKDKETANLLGDRPQDANTVFGYPETKVNGVRCIQLVDDDTFKKIARHTGISVAELLYFNDLPKAVDLHSGDIVYLQPKKNKTNKRTPTYTVKAGDSMHSISQEYGIKLKALYKLNGIKYGTPAEVGQRLKLHK